MQKKRAAVVFLVGCLLGCGVAAGRPDQVEMMVVQPLDASAPRRESEACAPTGEAIVSAPRQARIPEGNVKTGCQPERQGTCLGQHVSELAIDQQLVSWSDYARCTAKGVCASRQPKEKGDLADVTWFEADAYCRWRGMRLPSESERQRAHEERDGVPLTEAAEWLDGWYGSYSSEAGDTFIPPAAPNWFSTPNNTRLVLRSREGSPYRFGAAGGNAFPMIAFRCATGSGCRSKPAR